MIAVAASTAIGYFGARLNDAMLLRASEFLGADLVLGGSAPASAQQIDAGKAQGLEHAQVVEFSSVIATDQDLQLASVKAASSSYPLRGALRSAAQPRRRRSRCRSGPGEAWAEARLFAALDLAIGDDIEVGNKLLRLTRVLTYEPDRVGDFYSLTPRVHAPGRSCRDRCRPARQPSALPGALARRKRRTGGLPAGTAARAASPSTHRNRRRQQPADRGALGRAERYLNLASLAAILLAGVAVALSAARFATRRFDASALLRCLGLSRHDALLLYTLQLGMLGLLASLVGALLGWPHSTGCSTSCAICWRRIPAASGPPQPCGHGSGGAGGLCPSAIGRTGSRTTIAGTAPRPAGATQRLGWCARRSWPSA